MGSREKFETLENNGLEISVNTKMIKKVQITESLGLTIHEHLTWKNNINNIIKKICSGISALKRSRPYIERNSCCEIIQLGPGRYHLLLANLGRHWF